MQQLEPVTLPSFEQLPFFSRDPLRPRDVQLLILDFSTAGLGPLLRLRLVSTYWKYLAEILIKRRLGMRDIKPFNVRVTLGNVSPRYLNALLWSQTYRWTLQEFHLFEKMTLEERIAYYAERNISMVGVPQIGVERVCAGMGMVPVVEGFITPEQVAQMNHHVLCELLGVQGQYALREKLITADQLIKMKLDIAQLLLNTKEGHAALREKLITDDQVSQLTFGQLLLLLSANGLIALREKLITFAQLQWLSMSRLELLLDRHFSALQQGWITADQAIQISNQKLSLLLTDNYFSAVREKLITPDQTVHMEWGKLIVLLTINGLMALREELITLEQVTQLSQYKLELLLRDNGLAMLRTGEVSIEDAMSMSTGKLASKIFWATVQPVFKLALKLGAAIFITAAAAFLGFVIGALIGNIPGGVIGAVKGIAAATTWTVPVITGTSVSGATGLAACAKLLFFRSEKNNPEINPANDLLDDNGNPLVEPSVERRLLAAGAPG